MLNITFDGKPLTVSGVQLQVGDKAPDFKDVTMDFEPFALDKIQGVKVISAVPSLDTGVCQIQTIQFNKKIVQFPDVKLITISLDLPFAQRRWCGTEGLENTETVSDYQNREFATKYNLLIDQLKLLSRSVFVLDQDNIVRYVEYVSELMDEPCYIRTSLISKEPID